MDQPAPFDDPEPVGIQWLPRRQAALARLEQFLPLAGAHYARRRNYDLGPEDRSNISCLSPWIRHRTLLEQEVLVHTLARFGASTAERFVQEVFWRGYFKGWLEHRPGVWQYFCQELENAQRRCEQDSTLYHRYQAAITGSTGIDCLDSWSRELVKTNYLHNHARMWFASIWIFTLKLPWQLGAGFFLQHLLDGDPAANTLSWRWVGGLHTTGKAYGARADNIERFTAGRFNPHSQLAPVASPLVEDDEHPLLALPAQARWTASNRYGLLLTEEDTQSESLELPTSPAALAVLPPAKKFGPVAVASPVLTFRKALLTDASRRAQNHFDHPPLSLPNRDPKSLLGWARDENLDAIALSLPPVGPTRDWLVAARNELSAAGIGCHTVLRRYDALLWPHTTAGFFKLRKKIPNIVRSMV